MPPEVSDKDKQRREAYERKMAEATKREQVVTSSRKQQRRDTDPDWVTR